MILEKSPTKIKSVVHEVTDASSQTSLEQKSQLKQKGYDWSEPEIMLETFEKYFCRRCYKYSCKEHGIFQPRKLHRRLPTDSLLKAEMSKFAEIFSDNLRFENTKSMELITEAEKFKGPLKKIQEDSSDDVSNSQSIKSTPTQVVSCGNDCFMNSYSSSSFPMENRGKWDEMSEALCRKFLLLFNQNVCQVAKAMGTKNCSEVFSFALEQDVLDLRIELKNGVEDGKAASIEISSNPSRPKRKRPRKSFTFQTGTVKSKHIRNRNS